MSCSNSRSSRLISSGKQLAHKACIAFCLLSVTVGNLLATESHVAPNVILIVADDLGYGDVSTYGNDEVPTPNIDRIAQDGVLFTQAYSVAAVCSPSRAGLITGRYPHRYGFEFNAGDAERVEREGLGLDAAEITLADMLKAQGYRTGLVGKWHLGSQDGIYRPNDRGFDYFFGIHSGQTLYIDPNLPDVISRPRLPNARAVLQEVYENDVIVDNFDVYLTEDFTAKAIDFITDNQGVRFFLNLSYTAPHRPLQVTEKYLARFSDEPDLSRRIYKAMIAAMDDGIGEILDTLDFLDLARDTMVIFTSDNGCVFVRSCNPGTLLSHLGVKLYGGKYSYFEGGIRVPFIMKWPRGLPKGQVDDRYVSGLDIVPTVIAATQAELPKDRRYDGTDLMPYVTGANVGNPHDYLFWKTDHLHAIRRGPWKLYEALQPNPENYLSPPAVFPPPFALLFDVGGDPGELINQAVSEPAKVELLRRKFSVFEESASEPAWPARELRQSPMEVEGTRLYVPY